MKTLIAVVALCLPLLARAETAPNIPALTPEEVQAKLKDKNVYVYDNNVEDSWKEAHVPGAKWLHPNEYKAADLPSDKTATLIFYCANEH